MKNSVLKKFLYYRDLGDDLYGMDWIAADEFINFADSLSNSDLFNLSRVDLQFYYRFIALAWELKKANEESDG